MNKRQPAKRTASSFEGKKNFDNKKSYDGKKPYEKKPYDNKGGKYKNNYSSAPKFSMKDKDDEDEDRSRRSKPQRPKESKPSVSIPDKN